MNPEIASETSLPTSRPLGIVINPMSGRDARRLFARAQSSTHESKRNQIERIIVGAAAAGVPKVLLVHDVFRIADAAIEALGVHVDLELADLGTRSNASDTEAAVRWMRERGCGALAVLGGDGTNRIVSRTWPDAPILPVSTGTNNVFPVMLEATVAGAAAGLVAAGAVPLELAGARAKVVHVEVEGEDDDLALIDAVHLVNDSTGNLLPFDPALIRTLVLSRALPWSVGMSPIGGLLHPATDQDDFGVRVHATSPDGDGRPLLAPISPGLYRKVYVTDSGPLELGERVEVVGPGILAFDGDRERKLAQGQRAWLRVERDGPFVLDARRILLEAAARGVYIDPGHWHDERDGMGLDCC